MGLLGEFNKLEQLYCTPQERLIHKICAESARADQLMVSGEGGLERDVLGDRQV